MAEKEKELRRMSRMELIEIIYALKNSEMELIKEKEALEEQLRQRTIKISEAGSIAEAAVSLNQFFTTAQWVADDYVNSVKALQAEAEEYARNRKKEAEKEAEEILAEARKKADKMYCSMGVIQEE